MCGASRRSSRAHSAWNVEIHICRQSMPSSVSTRVRISSAALLVKVTARMRSGGRCSLADEVRDAVRDDARLAGARAGQDQQRAVGLKDSFLLFGIEAGEEIQASFYRRHGPPEGGHSQVACVRVRLQPDYSTVTLFARFRG